LTEVVLSADGQVRLSAGDLAGKGEAILATRGAGKSWLAAVQAEQLIEAGYPVLILDVVGEYWSLKAKYPIIVFGGRHADVPLDPHIGGEIAKVVLDRKLQAVIDLTGMRRADQPFFIADLATELYEHGLQVKTPCWLLIEEAQNFIPQVGNPPCKRPILDIVEMGRHAGLGVCLVSHRSATIDKTALGLCDILVFKRLTLPHDLQVVRDFFRGRDPKFIDVVKELPALGNDEAILYYPLRLETPVKFKVAERKTPHIAETPTLEIREVTAPEVSAVSKELTEYFQQLVREKVERHDEATELRMRVEELQKELEERDRRIEQLEHDLELAQRFRIEIPPELLKVPGVNEKLEKLEERIMDLYAAQVEKAKRLEEENRALKRRLELAGKADFSALAEKLEALNREMQRSRGPLASLSESLSGVVEAASKVLNDLKGLSRGFVSAEEHMRRIEEIRREYEQRIEEMRNADAWRLNPHIIIRMSRIVNEIAQLTDTAKQVLKVASSMRPDVIFDESTIAHSVGRSPSTVRQYLRQLAKLGWLTQTRGGFKNRIEENVADRISKSAGPAGKVPCTVIEKCKREILTFIQSL